LFENTHRVIVTREIDNFQSVSKDISKRGKVIVIGKDVGASVIPIRACLEMSGDREREEMRAHHQQQQCQKHQKSREFQPLED
jgi:hypothetical protein